MHDSFVKAQDKKTPNYGLRESGLTLNQPSSATVKPTLSKERSILSISPSLRLLPESLRKQFYQQNDGIKEHLLRHSP